MKEIFHTQFIGMFMIPVFRISHVQFQLFISYPIKGVAGNKFHMISMHLFYILQKYDLKKVECFGRHITPIQY